MTILILAFASASQTFNLPYGLLESLCYVESKHNASKIHYNDGGSDSLGVCQIKFKTAQGEGFKGNPKALLDPKVNAYYAAKYLAKHLKKYNNNTACAVAAYNAGKCRVNTKGYIKNSQYVNKVLKTWESSNVYTKL